MSKEIEYHGEFEDSDEEDEDISLDSENDEEQ